MITYHELCTISHLISALSCDHQPTRQGYLGIDVTLTDANGETLGTVQWDSSVDEYVFTAGESA